MLDKAEEFLEYVKKNKSKNTYNVYGFGLRKFLDWIKTDPNTIIADAKKKFLAEDRETREYWKRQIETFYNSLLKDGLMKTQIIERSKTIMQEKDAIIEAQRKEIEQLRFQFKLLANAQSEQIKKALLAKLKAEGYHEAVVFRGKPHTTIQINGEKVNIEPMKGPYTISNILEKLSEIEQLKTEKAFKKGLEEINGENGNNHNGDS